VGRVTEPATIVAARSPRLSIVETSSLLFVAAVAWVATIVIARDMGVMPGTMGLGIGAFLGVWALMMSAMMLPSITPLASLYARTMRDNRPRRLGLLALGYLVAWTAMGFVAFGLAAGGDRLAQHAPGWAQAVAVGSCFACGIYQMTNLKDLCLQKCRSPLGHLLHYASFRGPLADVRVGLHHGAWCVACCWALMLLLITFGVMSVVAMLVLAAVIILEKVLLPGRWFSITVGVAAFALGVAIWIHPSLAGGLHASTGLEMM
jgi:predicted metal-binding membrane protein